MTPGKIAQTLKSQFGKPSGVGGRIVGLIIANRPSNRERTFRTIDLLDIQSGDRVLEIGFGPGLGIAQAARLAVNGKVVGIDHSPLMVTRASGRNAVSIDQGRVELHAGSVAEMMCFSFPFDKAFAVNVHMFWADRMSALANVKFALKPGGTFALTFQPRNARATNQDAADEGRKLEAELGSAGFVDIRTKVLRMKPVNAVCVFARRPAK